MKKIVNWIMILGATLSFSSCNLEMDPDTALKGDDAATLEYVNGMRLGVYSGLKSITSGGYLYFTDYQTDLVNETLMSGNRGGFFYRMALYASDQDVQSMWSGYYALINRINYTIQKIDQTAELNVDNTVTIEKLDRYRAEMYFIRAYTLNQIALRFCDDYDPAKATTQLGVPTPDEFNPDAQLARGTLAQTYTRILSDITKAEAGLSVIAGAQNSIFATRDAVTAFKAQVALQMHDYTNAALYAKSLYAAYPLVKTREAMEKMWREDASTENILQLELKSTSLGTVSSMYDYYSGTWNSGAATYYCSPGYTLTKTAADLFDKTNDIRVGSYITNSIVVRSGKGYQGYLLTKFLGNKLLQTSPTNLTYRNMPKVFRVAEMYLIEAEALYNTGGDAATPLNALRQARGLAATTATGAALFTEIQKERTRELIGEGRRLADLKRWGLGFTRNYQNSFAAVLRSNTINVPIPANYYMFTWPIPQEELAKNPNIGTQNTGYMD